MSPLAVIFLTILVDLMGIGILFPIIPLLLADPQSPYFLLPDGASLQSGYILLGILTAVYPLMIFFAAPILGQLSDRYGRRKVLALSLAGTCASYLLFILGIYCRNIPLLFLSRALDGATGGNISVAQAAIADITRPENRAKNFGLIGAAFGLGFIIGPLLGGKLSDPGLVSWFNATTPFWLAAGLSALNVISVLLFFPETFRSERRTKFRWNQAIQNIRKAVRSPSGTSLFTTSFLYHSGLGFFFTFFAVYLIERFGYHQSQIGDFFAYIGLCTVFVQTFLIRKMSKKDEAALLRFTIAAGGVMIALHVIPHKAYWLYLLVPFFAAANGLTQANLMSLLSRTADKETQGEILGINTSVQALAQAIPPILSGIAAAFINPQASILIGSVLAMMAAVWFRRTWKNRAAEHI